MSLNLTVLQRRILMFAAGAVAVLLWIEASREGLDDTPWLLGVLIIAALLIVAFAPSKPVKEISDIPEANIIPSKAVQAAYEVYEAAFLPVVQNAIAGMPKSAINDAMADNVRLQAGKLAYVTALLALELRYPGYRTGPRFQEFGLIGGQLIRQHLRKMPGIAGPKSNSTSLNAAATEIGESTLTFDAIYKNMLEKAAFPLNPAYAMVEKAFPFAAMNAGERFPDVAARLDGAYGPIFRKASAAVQAS